MGPTRSPSEIVDAAFQILRAHYAQFVMCSAIAYLPWLLVRLVIASNPMIMSSFGVASSFAVAIGAWLVFALMSAVLVVCASQAYLGDPVDVGLAVRTAVPKLGSVMIATVVKYVCMFLGLLAFFVGALYVAARMQNEAGGATRASSVSRSNSRRSNVPDSTVSL